LALNKNYSCVSKSKFTGFQTQNGPRIHEKSKQTNTKVETSDSRFG